MSDTRVAYDRPYRPWPLRAANTLGGWVGLGSRPRLTPHALIDAAVRAEGLSDFGPPGLEPLDVLCTSIEDEARLHALGRQITFYRLVGVLRNRLLARAAVQRDPSIVQRPLPGPIVITGLQRTGTTFLHRLIGADPGLRALYSWEALAPVPRPGAPTGDRDPRRRQARLAEAGLRWMAPDFFAVHPVEAEAPEEEVLLLDQSLLSTVPEATLRVPSFSAWLEQQDQRPAYETMARLLQLLQPGARWVLKTPHHLEWLDVLLDVFPNATVVMTHRDPLTTLASFCSMVAHGRGVMSDHVDPREIGRDWLRKVGRMTDRALAVRDARPDARFIDVDYRDLVADPLATVQRIYASAGVPFTPDAEAGVERVRTSQTKDRHGSHRYALADFGLREGEVAERFSRWRQRFGHA